MRLKKMKKCQKCDRNHLAKGLCNIHYLQIYNKNYRKTNRDKLNEKDRLYRKNNPNIIREWKTKNKDHIEEYNRKYRLENPKSRHYQDDIELQLAINNVRIRDKNTCQWYKCRLTHKEITIDVNHIFPISEYPDLRYIEQYMICYCKKHHSLWHEFRGDPYYKMIKSKSIYELAAEQKQ